MDYESYLSESLTFKTHYELIKSQEVMERAIKRLKTRSGKVGRMGGYQGPNFNPITRFFLRLKGNIQLLLSGGAGKKAKNNPLSAEEKQIRLARALGGMVMVTPVEETRLLKISVTSPSPQFAKNLANVTAESYIEFNTDNRMKATQNTLKWLTAQLYEMKKKLEDAEAEFLKYKQNAKLLSMEDSQKVIAQKITDFNDAYLKARNRRMELDAKLSQLRRFSSVGGVPHLRSLIDNELINALYGELVKSEVELSRLSKVYKAKHPKVVQIKTKIENTRRKLNQELQKEINSLKAQRAVLLAKERVLQKTIADFEKEGLDANKKQLRYTILKRNVDMNQRVYDALLTRMKEADITGNIDVSNIRITERALIPTFPVGPNKKRNLLLGIVFGLMLGVGISFLREYIDRSIRTEDDIQKYLGLPVLSVIPRADQAEGKGYYGTSRTRKSSTQQKPQTAKRPTKSA
jgi:uncharacterized protein involved in exopolysaccharide biosynthesis